MCKVGHKGWASVNLGDVNFAEPFQMSFDLSEPVEQLAFEDAASMTAKLIDSEFDNLHILLSGGLDSEYVAKIMLKNDIAFTPVIVKLQKNGPESWYAFKFCFENNLKPLVLDFSDNDAFADFAQKLLLKSKQLDIMPVVGTISNVIADMLPNSSIITGFGDPLNISKTYSEPMGEMCEMWDHDFYLELEFHGRHPGAFFTYTPEIFFALVKDIDYTMTSQEAKSKLYGLLPRPKLHVSALAGDLPNHIKYVHQKRMDKYLNLSEDRFLQKFSKEELLSQLSGLSASSRFTNSAAYAKINIGEKHV